MTQIQQSVGWSSFVLLWLMLSAIATADEPPGAFIAAVREGNVAAITKTLADDPDLINLTDERGFTPLHHAIDAGQHDAALALIEAGAPLNVLNGDGVSPLKLAVNKRATGAVDALLARDVNVDLRGPDVWTPLMSAIGLRDTATARKLIEAGAALDLTVPRDRIPLLDKAIHCEQPEIVLMMLDRGIDPWEWRLNGRTILVHAASHGLPTVVERLLSMPEPPGGFGIDLLDALQGAVIAGSVKTIDLLIDHGTDVNGYPPYTHLHFAVQQRQLESVKRLIKRGARVDIGQNYLVTALEVEDPAIAFVLLEHGVPVSNDAYNRDERPLNMAVKLGESKLALAILDALRKQQSDPITPEQQVSDDLLRAAYRGDREQVLKLLNGQPRPMDWATALAGPIASQQGWIELDPELRKAAYDAGMRISRAKARQTDLGAATTSGNLEEIRQLIAAGADPNDDGWNESPLFRAINAGKAEALDLLLTLGADPHATYGDDPALAIAFTRGTPEMVNILLRHGAKIEPVLKDRTTIAFVASHGDADVVRRMLEAGASPNAISYAGRTALMEAAERGDLDIVNLLLEHGAKVNLFSDEGYTALMFAENEYHDAVVDRLIEAGARRLPNRITWSPLFNAIDDRDLARLKFLLDRGESVNDANDKRLTWGRGALEAAVDKNWPEGVLELLKRGAKVRLGYPVAGGEHSQGMVHHTLTYWERVPVEVFAAVLDAADDPLAAAQDRHGWHGRTPLMLATLKDRPDLVKLLLERGADPSVKDDQGHTAADLARQKGNAEVLKLLQPEDTP